MNPSALQKRLGYSFRDPNLLLQALTHSSFAYEAPDRTPGDNEVLEFLGDSVLGLVVADFVCSAYPTLSEGELSKLKSSAASTLALAELAQKTRLDKLLRLGKGEEKSGGRKKKTILADAFEAVIGALYLDGGYPEARRVLRPFLEAVFKKIKAKDILINNYKSALQEYLQKQDWPPPAYRTVESTGPDHRRTFTVEVALGARTLGRASGPSKKAAEQKAAQKALKKIWGRKIKELSPNVFLFKKK